MTALFLGGFAASVAPRILAKVKTPFETEILADESDTVRLAPLLAEGEIVVGCYAALKDGRRGGAAIDVWWHYRTPSDPERRPSRHPFHELPNVLMTPHCSAFAEATAERRWRAVAGNLDCFASGEPLANL